MTDQESDAAGDMTSLPAWFTRIHPLGWVAVAYAVTATEIQTFLDDAASEGYSCDVTRSRLVTSGG